MKQRHVFHFLLAMLLIGTGCADEPEEDYAGEMAEQHEHDTTAATPITAEPDVPIDTSSVQYWNAGGRLVTGYMAVPADIDSLGVELGDSLPAIIVIHEWWGLNDNIKAMTRRLAGEGFRALAVDLYGGQVATQPQEAQQYVQQALQNQPVLIENLEAAYQYLIQQQNALRVGVIGWCFGGAQSLRAALAMPDALDATVIYYGPPADDRDALETLEMPVLGFFGAADESIPVEDVRAFEQTLRDLGKDVEVHVYEGAGHAFANPTGNNYVDEAAQDAWSKTVAFFNEHLSSAGGS